ncbi:MAG: DedA family protein [Microvirga sp.]|nr:DedA family protein [Microvirga sp.]
MAAALELLTLFLVAFASSTILPGASEATLAGVIALGTAGVGLAVIVATFGNTLGSIVNWLLGRYAARFRDHPRFPLSPERYERYAAAYRRWGVWSLLLSWAPVIGDPLTLVAGAMRTPLWIFVPLVTLAKGARYLVVAGAAQLI